MAVSRTLISATHARRTKFKRPHQKLNPKKTRTHAPKRVKLEKKKTKIRVNKIYESRFVCFQRSAELRLRRTGIIQLIWWAEMLSAWSRKWTRINIFKHGVMVHSSQHHHAFVNTDTAQTAKRWIFKLNKIFPFGVWLLHTLTANFRIRILCLWWCQPIYGDEPYAPRHKMEVKQREKWERNEWAVPSSKYTHLMSTGTEAEWTTHKISFYFSLLKRQNKYVFSGQKVTKIFFANRKVFEWRRRQQQRSRPIRLESWSRKSKNTNMKTKNEKWKESFAAAFRCFPRILVNGVWCFISRVSGSRFHFFFVDFDAKVLAKSSSRRWLQFAERRHATRSIRIIRFTSVRIEVKVRRPKTMGFRTASKSWNCSKQKSGSTSDMLRVNWLSLLSFSHRRLPADVSCAHVKVLQRPKRFCWFRYSARRPSDFRYM